LNYFKDFASSHFNVLKEFHQQSIIMRRHNNGFPLALIFFKTSTLRHWFVDQGFQLVHQQGLIRDRSAKRAIATRCCSPPES
jgi:hypothetical protein